MASAGSKMNTFVRTEPKYSYWNSLELVGKFSSMKHDRFDELGKQCQEPNIDKLILNLQKIRTEQFQKTIF